MSFTGAPLFDLFSREAEMLENSYNRSIREMFFLPRETHRAYLEPISENRHLKSILIKRFLNFIEQIKKTKKTIPRRILKIIKYDVSSVTGSNLRNIMLVVGKNTIDDLNPTDAGVIQYAPLNDEDEAIVVLLKELIEVKHGDYVIEEFDKTEIDDIIRTICVD